MMRLMQNPSCACRLLDALAVELGVNPLYLLCVRQPVRTHGPGQAQWYGLGLLAMVSSFAMLPPGAATMSAGNVDARG